MKFVYLSLLLVCVVCLGVRAQPNVPVYVPTAGLQAWFSFKGNADDSSGTGNHGTNYGATLTSDRRGAANSAYYFNGTSNYIYVPPSSTLDLPKEVSLLAWFKPATLTGTMQLFWRGDARGAYDPYMLYFPGSGSLLMRRDVGSFSTTTQTGFSTSLLDTVHFFMVVGTFTPGDDSMRIYLNGRKVTSAYLPGGIGYSTAGFWNVIGAVDHGGQFFKGTIDDVGAWNRKLADCEIERLYLGLNTLITAHPRDTTRPTGDSAVFTISDTGMVTTYHWQEDNGSGFHDLPATSPYSGVNTRRLRIYPLLAALSGRRYRCIHDAGTCLDSSNSARLIVTGNDNSGGTDTSLAVGAAVHTPEVLAFPNPANTTVTLTGIAGCTPDGLLDITLRDMAGRLLLEQQQLLPTGAQSLQVQLPVLPCGSYLLRVSGGTRTATVRLVINR